MALTSLISLINSSGDRLTIESTWCEHIRLVANMIEQLGLETTQPLEVPVADKADKRTLELIKVSLFLYSYFLHIIKFMTSFLGLLPSLHPKPKRRTGENPHTRRSKWNRRC